MRKRERWRGDRVRKRERWRWRERERESSYLMHYVSVVNHEDGYICRGSPFITFHKSSHQCPCRVTAGRSVAMGPAVPRSPQSNIIDLFSHAPYFSPTCLPEPHPPPPLWKWREEFLWAPCTEPKIDLPSSGIHSSSSTRDPITLH